jgi:hypothetical protein
VNACLQSTLPLTIGITSERNASPAEATAIGIAKRITHFTPHKLMTVKKSTMHDASRGTGNQGKYHWLIADADRRAVSPHVGTQPHQ